MTYGSITEQIHVCGDGMAGRVVKQKVYHNSTATVTPAVDTNAGARGGWLGPRMPSERQTSGFGHYPGDECLILP